MPSWFVNELKSPRDISKVLFADICKNYLKIVWYEILLETTLCCSVLSVYVFLFLNVISIFVLNLDTVPLFYSWHLFCFILDIFVHTK